MAKRAKNTTPWQNRIVAHTDEDPAQLLAHPLNFRRHPGKQRDALRGSLNELGWLKSVLVNKTTGHVLDGHARVEEALSKGGTVPVDWVELTPEEERLALAVLDPISEMATRDDEALAGLLAEVETQDEGLAELLRSMADEAADGLLGEETPEKDKLVDEIGVVIPCADEAEQMTILAKLQAVGLPASLATIKGKKGAKKPGAAMRCESQMVQ